MHPQFIEDLIGFIQIPSVYDAHTKTHDQPYGKAISDALAYFKSLAERDGFEVETYAGHAISISYGSQCERIDVVSHCDVVEVGDDWDYPPFQAVIADSKLYGRGTQDMKTAALLTYYALKEMRDHHIQTEKQVRVVIGADEERTMKDIEFYIAQAGQPAYAFTPDGAFPVLHAEKGALMWTLGDHFDTEGFTLVGGVQCNVVAPRARLVVDPSHQESIEARIQQLNINATVKVESEGLCVEIIGKAAHASTPDAGHNALVDGLKILSYLFPKHTKLKTLTEIFSDAYGEAAGLAIQDTLLGRLTLNLGTLSLKDHQIKSLVDVRYPSGTDGETLTTIMRDKLKGIQISLDYDAPSVTIDCDSPYIQACIKAYQDNTQDYVSQPYVSGGVTYCKVIERCTAFGIHFPGQKSLAHQRNEAIELSDFDRAYPILRDAMIMMAQIKETS